MNKSILITGLFCLGMFFAQAQTAGADKKEAPKAACCQGKDGKACAKDGKSCMGKDGKTCTKDAKSCPHGGAEQPKEGAKKQ